MLYGLPDGQGAPTVANMDAKTIKRERSEAQIEAERRYRESKRQLLIRFTPEEMDEIQHASGGDDAAWVKAKALAAARRARH